MSIGTATAQKLFGKIRVQHHLERAEVGERGVQDKVVFVFNFGDYLRTIAPGTK